MTDRVRQFRHWMRLELRKFADRAEAGTLVLPDGITPDDLRTLSYNLPKHPPGAPRAPCQRCGGPRDCDPKPLYGRHAGTYGPMCGLCKKRSSPVATRRPEFVVRSTSPLAPIFNEGDA